MNDTPHKILSEKLQESLKRHEYVITKISKYDKVLNDFADLKLVLEKIVANSESAKRTAEESHNISLQLTRDIDHLRSWLREESIRYDHRYDQIKSQQDLNTRQIEANRRHHDSSDNLVYQKIMEKLFEYVTVEEMNNVNNFHICSQDILEKSQDITQSQINRLIEDVKRIDELNKKVDTSNLEINKRICILQNKFVRDLSKAVSQ